MRAAEDSVQEVRSLLGATAYPEHPEEVQVSRPSDALRRDPLEVEATVRDLIHRLARAAATPATPCRFAERGRGARFAAG